jgi:hypothetical protein
MLSSFSLSSTDASFSNSLLMTAQSLGEHVELPRGLDIRLIEHWEDHMPRGRL